VCIYTCVYSYVYTFIHTYIHAYIHTQMHTYIHTGTQTHTHTHTHTHIRIYMHTYVLHTYTHTCMHTYTRYNVGLAVVGGRMLAASISEKTVALAGGVLFLLFALHGIYTVCMCVYILRERERESVCVCVRVSPLRTPRHLHCAYISSDSTLPPFLLRTPLSFSPPPPPSVTGGRLHEFRAQCVVGLFYLGSRFLLLR
jgi:hypothetical protein